MVELIEAVPTASALTQSGRSCVILRGGALRVLSKGSMSVKCASAQEGTSCVTGRLQFATAREGTEFSKRSMAVKCASAQ